MAQEPGSGEWKKGLPSGAMERTTISPFGSTVREVVRPGLGQKTTTESFPQARRVIIERADTTDANTHEAHALLDLFGIRSRVVFLGENDAVEHLEQIGTNSLQVLLTKATPHDIDQGIPQTPGHSFTVLKYDGDTLADCRLQAELPTSEKAEEIADWRASLPSYLGYLRTADDEEIRKFSTASRDILEEREEVVREEIEDGADEVILEAHQIARGIVTAMVLTEVPNAEKADTFRLVSDRDLQAAITTEILEEALAEQAQTGEWLGEMVDEVGKDEFIRRVMEQDFEVWGIYQDLAQPRQVVDLLDFGEDGFQWRDIAIDIDKANRYQPVETEGRVAETPYGQEIQVLDNTFKIDRNGDIIAVACKDVRGNNRWQAAFPLSAPIDKVLHVSGDKKADFREIQSLLPIDLQLPGDTNARPATGEVSKAQVEPVQFTLRDGMREIDEMYQRLMGADKLFHTQERTEDENAVRALKNFIGEAKIAKSETLATPDEIDQLKGKVEAIREIISEKGSWSEGGANPDIEEGSLGNDDHYVVVADASAVSESERASEQELYFSFKNEDKYDFALEFALGYDGGYSFDLDYMRDTNHPGNINKKYTSMESSLAKLPANEYKIMMAFLDNFISTQKEQ